MVAISIFAKRYLGPSEQSSLRSLTPGRLAWSYGWVVVGKLEILRQVGLLLTAPASQDWSWLPCGDIIHRVSFLTVEKDDLPSRIPPLSYC